ncbi:Uncharacterised protein [uncultured archaeon]|nr:Uncharacterised protein [uncultured archaeon]
MVKFVNLLLDTSALVTARNTEARNYNKAFALMERLKIETLLTFDIEFKGLVNLVAL